MAVCVRIRVEGLDVGMCVTVCVSLWKGGRGERTVRKERKLSLVLWKGGRGEGTVRMERKLSLVL
jgi:hypothetical protein